MTTLFTIGHSNRTIEGFLELLRAFGIHAIADVRRYPGSRRSPQFGSDALRATLRASDIAYEWMPALGGRRTPRPDSDNAGWRNLSFRGYADHMETEAFAEGLADLLSLGSAMPTALMCSEALWWRCHRSLIADALEVSGVPVLHIVSRGEAVRHPMTSPARVEHGVLTYPAQAGATPDLFE